MPIECRTNGVYMLSIYRLDQGPLHSKNWRVMADFSPPIKEKNQHTIRINDSYDLPWSDAVGISHIYWCAIRGIYEISNILPLSPYDKYNFLLCSVLQYDHHVIYSYHLWNTPPTHTMNTTHELWQ
jgi:hypothetical protein